jgi:hypothetical protein
MSIGENVDLYRISRRNDTCSSKMHVNLYLLIKRPNFTLHMAFCGPSWRLIVIATIEKVIF